MSVKPYHPDRFASAAAALLALVLGCALAADAQAATYVSLRPDRELCTSIVFGEHGRGEYTLTSPSTSGEWIDNHFTSFMAGPENIIFVPVCFSSRGRKVSDSAMISFVLSTPSQGNVTYDFGVCVSNYEDIDVTDGAASSSPCGAMAAHTDIISASLEQPDMYASPGQTVVFTLLADSSLPLTLAVSKESGDMRIAASASTIEAGAGLKTVGLQVTAPASAGDYPFSVIVAAQGCSIDDCTRTVRGVLHVRQVQQQPQAGFFVWLSPETKSVMGQASTMYMLKFQNYGEGQQFTATVAADEGLETDFSTYSSFVAKGDGRSVPFTVRPLTAEKKTYKLKATVTAADGSEMAAESWLTIDEMVADADKLGQEAYIATYDEQGGSSLEQWEELQSVPGASEGGGGNGGNGTEPAPPVPAWPLYAAIAIIVALVGASVFLLFRRMKVEGSPSWNSLGV